MLIYGDQDTDITYDTLKLNANVTISDDNSRSQGNLVVEGSATFISDISGMNTNVMQAILVDKVIFLWVNRRVGC